MVEGVIGPDSDFIVHKDDLYETLSAWQEAQKDHVCADKHLVCSDLPLSRQIGTTCRGCGKVFYIDLSKVKRSMPNVAEEFRKLILTVSGRQELVDKINSENN
jgi:predicted nuclease with RNAse H fold